MLQTFRSFIATYVLKASVHITISHGLSRELTHNMAPISFLRKIPEPRVLRASADPQEVEFDLARSALIVVDMQNDFLHPEGWFPVRGVDPSPLLKCVPVIESLTTLIRELKVPVIWLNWGIRADLANVPQGVVDRGSAYGTKLPGYADESVTGKGKILVKDEWGTAIIDELTVGADDTVVYKHRLSGFWDSELDSVLRKMGVTTLLFAGVNIDRCVFSTLQDASFLGYDCIMVHDACATSSPEFVTQAVKYLLHMLYGVSTTYESLKEASSSGKSL
ncbi:Isochorismatase-like protein [Dipodascopsis tothii]|uniref:Isochorismatase-like protein n=1 Tax=Dipodascopsis tothii TaxID=44089 RepID=UPI0034CFF679